MKILSIALLLPLSVAQSAPTCDEVLSACHQALTDERSYSEKQRDLILQQKEEILSLKKPRPFYESPILWGVVGTVFGVWLSKEVRK